MVTMQQGVTQLIEDVEFHSMDDRACAVGDDADGEAMLKVSRRLLTLGKSGFIRFGFGVAPKQTDGGVRSPEALRAAGFATLGLVPNHSSGFSRMRAAACRFGLSQPRFAVENGLLRAENFFRNPDRHAQV